MFRQVRKFHGACRLLKAQLLDMPAMSPTMTEGGIVSWSIKPGDTFAAGDVLLDIETDKAQISVEAQDDGILAKIIKENGEKDIPVGVPIAVLADPEDDISSIDFNSLLLSAKKQPKAEETAKKAPEAPAAPVKEVKLDAIWLPSVTRLAHTLGIDPKDVKGTGPHGRVLKGDILAASGKISADAPKKLATEIKSRQHLDLSYQPSKPKEPAAAEAPKKKLPIKLEIDIGLEHLYKAGIPLDIAVAKASRFAIRDSILFTKPKASSLRSPTLDLLCEPKNKIPFSHNIQVLKARGQPLLIHVSAEYAENKATEAKANAFIERAQYYLSEGAGELVR